MQYLAASTMVLGWLFTVGSLLLVHLGGFDSWKLLFPLTLVGVSLLGWIFAAILSVVMLTRLDDRESLEFQLYVCSLVGSALPLLYFLIKFALYPKGWAGFLFDWLDYGWRWF